MRNLKRIGILFLISATIGGMGAPLPAVILDLNHNRYDIRVWNSANGLPQNLITAIDRIRDDYLWLGTQEGLIRFNGREFFVFTHRNVPEMTDNHVNVLAHGPDGRLWIGTNGGGLLGHVDGYFFRPVQGSALDRCRVTSLDVDSSGKVWIGTANQGLFALDAQADILNTPDIGRGRNKQIDCVFVDSRDRLWVAGPGFLLRGNPGSWTPVQGLPQGIHSINEIIEDDSGGVWIATENQGLLRVNAHGVRQWMRAEGLPSVAVNSVVRIHTGDIVAGTTDGVAYLSREGDFRSVTLDRRLRDVIVMCLEEDSEKNLWMGTYTGLIQNVAARVKLLDESTGLPENLIWAVHEDSGRNLWIGLQSRGLVRISPEGEMRHFTVADGLPSNVVRTVLIDSIGRLWLGTTGGLAVREKGEWRTFTTSQGLGHNTVRAVFEDSRGTIWIGTNAGIGVMKDGEIIRPAVPDGLSASFVFSFHEEKSGTIWIATSRGVWRNTGGRWRRFGAGSDLEGIRVFDVHRGNSRTLWFGTQSRGLCRWDGERFTWYTKAEGLLDNVIFKVLADNEDTLWLTSNKGIMEIPCAQFKAMDDGRISRLSPQYFGFDPGRSVLECAGGSQSAGLITESGLIMVPTIHGLAVIDPHLTRPSDYSPPIRVERIFVGNIPVDPSDSLVLAPGTTNLEFRFAALAFAPTTLVRYRYRLDGNDRQWQEVGGRNRAYYTNLSPGEYIFHVGSTRYDGTWSDQEAVFSFSIQPWFYQACWFRILAGLALAALIFLLFWLRLKALVRRKAELENQVEIQTRKLKELSLKDPLTGLQNRRFVSEVTQKEIQTFVKYKQYLQSHRSEGRRSGAENSVFGVYLFDIDHFKAYNDRIGHHEGDRLLVEFGNILTSSVREDDIVVRWGGEEFLVILKRTMPEYLDVYAQKILHRIGTHPFGQLGAGVSHIRITCSLGYCEFPFVDQAPDLVDLDNTIHLADMGMYEAKRNGRNMAVRVINETSGPEDARKMHQRLVSGESPDHNIPGVKFRFLKGPTA